MKIFSGRRFAEQELHILLTKVILNEILHIQKRGVFLPTEESYMNISLEILYQINSFIPKD